MYSAQNSNTFLAYFNQIDKFLSFTLGLKRYVPYIERITMIVQGRYSISSFVNRFESKLRYFGDLRNQLVHGYRLDSKHYLLVSDHAVEQVTTMHDELVKPKTVGSIYSKRIHKVKETDLLVDTIEYMKEKNLMYLPVYEGTFLRGIVSLTDMRERFLDKAREGGTLNLAKIQVKDVYEYSKKEYVTIASSTSVYQIHEIFTKDKKIEVVLITSDGDVHSELKGAISLQDLPSLEKSYLNLG